MVEFLKGPSSRLQTADFLLCSHRVKKQLPSSLVSFYKGTNPIHEGTTSCPNHLPKSLIPNTITLGIRFHIMNVGGHKDSVHTNGQLILARVLRQFNGEKTVFSTNGAGTT